MRVLSTEKRLAILHLLVEGNSIRSIERLAGVHRDTIMNLLVYAGNFAGDLLFHRMRSLKLRHVEVDEIWTFVTKKQGHLKPDEDDSFIGDQYVFVAIDQNTKLVPTFTIGKRTAANAEHFMLDLADRIRAPKPGEERIRLQISSDGFAAYPTRGGPGIRQHGKLRGDRQRLPGGHGAAGPLWPSRDDRNGPERRHG